MIELKKETERVILVGVCLPGQEDIDASLEELSELAKTAGAVTVGKVVQSRDQVHPGTYVGKGKIDEIKSLLWELDATGIICDDELSPAQMKNLQDELQRLWIGLWLFWIYLLQEHLPVKERFRLSWRSLSTDRRDLPDLELPCQGLAVVSVREVREKRSWRWTDVLLKIGSHF